MEARQRASATGRQRTIVGLTHYPPAPKVVAGRQPGYSGKATSRTRRTESVDARPRRNL